MNKPWKVVLAFVGVFIAGAICGGPLVGRWLRPDAGKSHAPSLSQMRQRLEKQLQLTDEQKTKIRPIFQKAQEETQRLRRENVKAVAAVLDEMHTQVAAVLTPEQKVKLEEMRKRFHERAEKLRKEFRDRERPPGPPPPDSPPPDGPPEPPRN